MKRILYLLLGILFFVVMIIAALVSFPQMAYYWGRIYVTGEKFPDDKIVLEKLMEWFDDRTS